MIAPAPSSTVFSAWSLEPLLSTSRDLGSRHASLFGSALRQPLSDVADVDLHLVISRLDRSAFGALLSAAEATVQRLATQVGRPWRVELRHGPFKPAPGVDRDLQLHLLLDDDLSWTRLPCALTAHRAATGILLTGEPLLGQRTDCSSRATWLREARTELTRWRDALTAREIVFGSWVLDPEPHLTEGRTAAETAWELSCLLRGAATTSDIHYRAAVSLACGARGVAENLARPLLSQLDGELPWKALSECWERVKDEAVTVIERRLERLLPLS